MATCSPSTLPATLRVGLSENASIFRHTPPVPLTGMAGMMTAFNGKHISFMQRPLCPGGGVAHPQQSLRRNSWPISQVGQHGSVA